MLGEKILYKMTRFSVIIASLIYIKQTTTVVKYTTETSCNRSIPDRVTYFEKLKHWPTE